MSLHPRGFEPCLPTASRTVPAGAQWAYEIKHDGFRFICHRDGERVRVFSRTGHEWGAQLPTVVAAVRALPVRSAIIDGEGVICGPDGRTDFDRMREPPQAEFGTRQNGFLGPSPEYLIIVCKYLLPSDFYARGKSPGQHSHSKRGGQGACM
jgi:hypothetical protein